MNRVFTVLLILLSLLTSVQAQFDYGCNGERYVVEGFDNIIQEEVQYGSNVLPNGDSTNLFMNVFYPEVDDADARPIFILAHSGAFISGNKVEMTPYCERLARLGYVAAAIDYRLLDIVNGIPDSIGSMDIAVKASHDMRAAIRYFKHSSASDNPYNIDGNMMFIGGYSAGAITALLAGVLDEGEISQDFILDVVDQNGGFEGNSGNPDYLIYDTDVQGILNLSGAIYDTSWIDINDPIIQSFHGTADETVGYGKAFASVLGIDIISLHGSGNIIQRTDNIGALGYLYTVEDGGHADIYFSPMFEDDRNSFTGHADTTFAEIICGTLVQISEEDHRSWTIYPNPTSHQLVISGIQERVRCTIFDSMGRLVHSQSIDREVTIDVSSLNTGLYSLQIQSEQGSQSSFFLIQR